MEYIIWWEKVNTNVQKVGEIKKKMVNTGCYNTQTTNNGLDYHHEVNID